MCVRIFFSDFKTLINACLQDRTEKSWEKPSPSRPNWIFKIQKRWGPEFTQHTESPGMK